MDSKQFEKEIENRSSDTSWEVRMANQVGRRYVLERALNGLSMVMGFLTIGLSFFYAYQTASIEQGRQQFIASQVNGIVSLVFASELDPSNDLAYGAEEMRDEVDHLIVETLKDRAR